jgi:hypothetical protein
VSRGAPNDRAGSMDAVMVTKIGPPPAIARDDLRGRLRPPRAEAPLVRERRAAELDEKLTRAAAAVSWRACSSPTISRSGWSQRRLHKPSNDEVRHRLGLRQI